MGNNFDGCYRFGLTESFYRQACADNSGRLYELAGFAGNMLRLMPLDFIGDDKYVSLKEFSEMLEKAYKLEPELVPDSIFRDMTGALSIASRLSPSQFNWYRHGAETIDGELYELVSVIDENTFVFSPMDEAEDAFITTDAETARHLLLVFCNDPDFFMKDRDDEEGIEAFFSSLHEDNEELCFSFAS